MQDEGMREDAKQLLRVAYEREMVGRLRLSIDS